MERPHPVQTRLALVVALIASVGQVAGRAQTAPPRLNLTGSWEGNFLGGSTFQLFQDGDRVWGKFGYGNGDGFARGSWNAGQLILILTPTTGAPGGSCDARKILVIKAAGSVTQLAPYVLDMTTNNPYDGTMTRKSPSPGPAVDYPYEAELKNCGQLFTYDLVFATNAATPSGTDWPILATLAALLKKDPALKIQVTGHTDSTGNAAANQDLSKKRASAVQQILIQHYGADPARVTTQGYGPDQPLASNDTEQGRAINRRVEIVLVS